MKEKFELIIGLMAEYEKEMKPYLDLLDAGVYPISETWYK